MRNSRVGGRSTRTWDACTLTEPSRLQVCLMAGRARTFVWVWMEYKTWSLVCGEHHLVFVSGVDGYYLYASAVARARPQADTEISVISVVVN